MARAEDAQHGFSVVVGLHKLCNGETMAPKQVIGHGAGYLKLVA